MKNNKSLGQHWLSDRRVLNEIADLAATTPTETCLEIGPGLGTLTSSLLKRFKKVVAVEFDKNLAKNLPNSFPGKNLDVINADFLKFDLNTLKKPYSVAGNIPYYITSPIIEKLLTANNRPTRIVLLVQTEVAERAAALDKNESLLSLFCKNYAKVSLGPVVDRTLFTPPPKVDSRVLIFSPKPAPEISPKIFSLVKLGFSSPRKKLLKNLFGFNNLSRDQLAETFRALNLDQNSRPSNLSLTDWKNLALALDLNLS
ncbi:ribosomal RNA small subunit methyltransferase A [Candidatus Saccharibacteria bacterium]|nr:ribosomal RNA small subunit methyltransferase A [Candidatus Saccharibacteria bacterium]